MLNYDKCRQYRSKLPATTGICSATQLLNVFRYLAMFLWLKLFYRQQK